MDSTRECLDLGPIHIWGLSCFQPCGLWRADPIRCSLAGTLMLFYPGSSIVGPQDRDHAEQQSPVSSPQSPVPSPQSLVPSPRCPPSLHGDHSGLSLRSTFRDRSFAQDSFDNQRRSIPTVEKIRQFPAIRLALTAHFVSHDLQKTSWSPTRSPQSPSSKLHHHHRRCRCSKEDPLSAGCWPICLIAGASPN
ncbi:hypothetical protein BO71DRAFT_168951 [Aspergillus ellipticus CBS 707.79]|uniref:Uncharacterized protein n=1 Tax=Aspergillus ellipticus CBS 707.79 TaxID=1448320 RepID=A0A319CQT9_9EURO|nr:hypothetical protein BO71DRAFT_168951 [Aspergillus ellipticus CBS 707.79]